MEIRIDVARHVDATPSRVFALLLDPDAFPATFRGYGPIAAIERIVLDAAPALGSTRSIHNADGSVLRERITALEPPNRHAYRLDGFVAPFAWLVRAGHADWRLEPQPSGSMLRWSYRFELTSPLLWPLCWPLLRVGMRTAMTRCLDAIAVACQPNETGACR